MNAAAPRRRRRWPWVLLIALGLGGFIFWRVALDRSRLTNFLIERARAELGLEIALGAPARFEFWPRLAMQAENVRASAAGATEPLIEARRLTVSVPWSALWSREIRIEAIRIEQPLLHLSRVEQWWGKRVSVDDGPPLPLRWPTIGSQMTLRNLRWIATEDAPTQGPLSVSFPRLAVDEAFAPTVRWRRDGITYRLQLNATPRNTEGGIALDELQARCTVDDVADEVSAPVNAVVGASSGVAANTKAATTSPASTAKPPSTATTPTLVTSAADTPTTNTAPATKTDPRTLTLEQRAMPLDFTGRLAFDSAAAWSAEVTVRADVWPAWLPPLPETGAPDSRSELALRVVRGGAAAFALVADGTLGGVPMRASLVGAALPDASRPLPEVIDEISRQWRGQAELPLLNIGGTRVEGLRIEAGEAPSAKP